MHSVTSNAVFNALLNPDIWTSGNGLTLMKIGKLVYLQFQYQINASSPRIGYTTVPSEYIPKDVDFRGALVNNATDVPCGQFIIRETTGSVDVYLGNGGTFNTSYCLSGCYVVN